jgi:hypothetical protein
MAYNAEVGEVTFIKFTVQSDMSLSYNLTAIVIFSVIRIVFSAPPLKWRAPEFA